MRRSNRRLDSVTIEIAPLIDIVFILLIFFVVTSTFIRETALELELPVAESSTMPSLDSSIAILITADNEIYLNDEHLAESNRDSLVSAMRELGVSPDQHLVIRADAKSLHETVVLTMDAAQTLGLTRIRIVTLKEDRG